MFAARSLDDYLVSVSVPDTSGSIIPQVKITLQNVDTAVTHSAHSNNAGNHVLLSITPGQYSLQVEAQGFDVSKRLSIRSLNSRSIRTAVRPNPAV